MPNDHVPTKRQIDQTWHADIGQMSTVLTKVSGKTLSRWTNPVNQSATSRKLEDLPTTRRRDLADSSPGEAATPIKPVTY
jgi:hypothetical protein